MGADLNLKLFSAADSLRSKMDASEYKNYLLGLIFYKYLSDKLLQTVVSLSEKSTKEYNTQEKQANLYRSLLDSPEREHFIESLVYILNYDIEPDYLFSELTAKARSNALLLEDLKKIFNHLSNEYEQFNGLFDDVDLNSKKLGANPQQRTATIIEVLNKLNDLDVLTHDGDVIGDAYEYLISQFASEAGKKAGEFYTPSEVSDMMARIAALGQEDKKSFTVYDPTMGSGSLMLNIRKYVNYPKNVRYHGQELNTTTYNLARMNLILHDVEKENMKLRNGDTLNADWPTDEPFTFDAVLMNPPYSAHWTAHPRFYNDSRFSSYMKLAPKTKADFAFLLHGFYHLKETGTMVIVLPHGVLFRGASEKIIRKKLLESGSIDAVIGVPPNLFFGTTIPTVVIVLKKERISRDVLFIDASKDFAKGKNQNRLTQQYIDKIITTYEKRINIDKYSHVAEFDEIIENDFNLNIPRYVDISEEEEPVDMASIGVQMKTIRRDKIQLEAELLKMVSSLGYGKENEDWVKGAIEVFKNEE